MYFTARFHVFCWLVKIRSVALGKIRKIFKEIGLEKIAKKLFRCRYKNLMMSLRKIGNMTEIWEGEVASKLITTVLQYSSGH